MIHQPDPSTIKLAMSGDTVAFRTLVESHQHFVFAVAHRFLRDKDAARDASQEVFVKLWKNFKKYKPEIKLSTWLYKITTNHCLDQIKARDKRQKVTRSIEPASPVFADRDLLHRELRMIALEEADNLAPKQRAVFVLRDLEELSMEEISDILDMDSASVKSNLYYARKKIAERLIKVYQLNQ